MRRRAIRRTVMVPALALSVGLLAACGSSSGGGGSGTSSGKGEVVVYNGGGAWGAAQEAAYFKPFEAATGIKVVQASPIYDAQMETQIQSGHPTIDAFDMDSETVPSWIAEGYLTPIDFSGWTAAQKAGFTTYPVGQYYVPSLIYALQVASNPNASGGPSVASWADFFNPSRSGKESMGDLSEGISVGTLDAAILAAGQDPSHLTNAKIALAFQELDKIRSRILTFWQSGAQSVQLLTDKQVNAVAAWNGRIQSAVEAGSKIASTWNQALLYHDDWVIPKGSKNAANASKFIEFASQPAQQAKFSQLITYGPTNSKAYSQIPASRQAILPNAPANIATAVKPDDAFWATKAPDGKLWSDEIQKEWQAWLTG